MLHHPEDLIYKAKTFINELQKVQDGYFSELTSNLNLTTEGEDWLHDYVYNSVNELYDDFDHYLQTFNKQYEQLVSTDAFQYKNSAVNLLSTDFAEYSPMMHMSSYEPDLETAFPPAYNDKEPFSLGLDTITVNNKNVQSDDTV